LTAAALFTSFIVHLPKYPRKKGNSQCFLEIGFI
jgi:hypothetical protein